jgi:hypothetical protein
MPKIDFSQFKGFSGPPNGDGNVVPDGETVEAMNM